MLIFPGETPSKRRRVSSETNESPESKDKENIPETDKVDTQNDEQSKDKPTSDKGEKTGANDTKKKTENQKEKSEGKAEQKKAQRPRSSSGPDIKESLGSPRPVTRPESPEPGPSQPKDQKRRTSQDEQGSSVTQKRRASQEEQASSSTQTAQRQRSSEEEAQRPRRERPLWVDIVAKHIESLFSLLAKSGTDS